MILTVTIRTDDGQSVDVIVLREGVFKTGSRGFYGNDKIKIGGKRYQVGCNVVEIGSKGKAAQEVPMAMNQE